MMLIKLFRLVLKIFFREITVSGLENVPASGPVIFTPNHPNALVDPLLLFLLPGKYRIRFVAKAALFKIPLLGWIMSKMGVIPVVRRQDTRGRVDYRTFFAACLDGLAKGNSIIIFPEGVSLPQPHMAPFRTGASRLYFFAREQGLQVPIVPVGINYEYGSIFRTPVMVSFGPPLALDDLSADYRQNPKKAVQQLTRELAQAMDEIVFQVDDLRDRELMLILERIYRSNEEVKTWPQRLNRLKEFATGLKVLRSSHAGQINQLRRKLVKYEQSMGIYHRLTPAGDQPQGHLSFGCKLLGIIALPLAVLGWIFTVIPYQLCRMMVNTVKKCDEAAAATYKIVYGFLLFPLAFFIEGLLIHQWLGAGYALLFALIILPWSYFTLNYFEWLADQKWHVSLSGFFLGRTISMEMSKNLATQRERIHGLVDHLYHCYENHTRLSPE